MDRKLKGTTLRVRVDLGVMAKKRSSAIPRAPGLKLQYQIQFSVIQDILLGGGVTLLQEIVSIFYALETVRSLLFEIIYLFNSIPNPCG